MVQLLSLQENRLHLAIEISETGDVRLLHFSALPFDPRSAADSLHRPWFRLVEIQTSGEGHAAHHGSKHVATMPGGRLVYRGHTDTRNAHGRKLEITQADPVTGLEVTSHLQFYDGIAILRAWTEVTNRGSAPVGLEYVSSFALSGLGKDGLQPWEKKLRLSIAHNSWTGELNWKTYTLPELGLDNYNDMFTMKRINIHSIGSESTTEYLPMGMLENSETGALLFWQIEHQGGWQWEISEMVDSLGNILGDELHLARPDLYLNLSGPNDSEHQWWKNLQPGERFVSVPTAVGCTTGGLEPAMEALTRYRRAIRRPNPDNKKLLVIFNDYMNCLTGDPTTEKELPLIDAAAEVGCEYFVIDAGWYGDGDWWSNVGAWKPSQRRFPGGLREVLDYIRGKGMIPGLWLELEVMGINNPRANEVPDDWFFCRHGKRVIDHGRYQLDFRNPQVIAHANEVVDRLVNEYGAGYIKMDYNINAGVGTDVNADSAGDGLLEHQRAYLKWLDDVFARYPELVIENCSSGGMRLDYAMLSRYSIQSTSDQTDYRRYARIAAASPTALTMEQSAIWSYPLRDGDEEEVIFNMVNAMLMRIHQSGHMALISPERRALVQEGLRYYKTMRQDIPQALPFWPLGLPQMGDGWMSLGLRTPNKTYLAVWRIDSPEAVCAVPVRCLTGEDLTVKCVYPQNFPVTMQWQKESGVLSVGLPQRNCARLFELE
jgi:alpha-galactosidase